MSSPGWTETDIPDQTGRVALVTGANSGIGFETARALAGHGARVLLGCRNPTAATEARRSIVEVNPDADVGVVSLDLADLASVTEAAATVTENEARLDLLVNNAGVMGIPRRETADGFEMQFGTNHLGHFALTAQLLPMLNAAEAARVVNVSSNAHKFGRVRFDDLMGERRYGKWRQYGLSKLSNLLFTYEMQRRLGAAGENTQSLAAHPGTSRTGLADEAGFAVKILGPLMLPLSHDAAAGALPTLRAATDEQAVGGEYYGPAGLGGFTGRPERVESNKASHDAATAARLWDVSEELTGVSFGI